MSNLSTYFKMSRSERQSGCVADFIAYPTPPSSNLWGWWNASNAYTDDGTTLCSSSGSDTCKQLNDLSGNSRHLTQSTAGNRPTWYSAQQNGYPALRFDGSSDFLQYSNGLNSALSFYIVFKQISWTNSDVIFHFDGTTSFELIQSGSSPSIQLFTTGGATITASSMSVGSYGLIAGVANTSSSLLKVDNNSDVTGTLAAVNATTLLNIGKGFSSGEANFDFCEFMVYDSAHSSVSGSGLAARQYLNSKYNLGLTI